MKASEFKLAQHQHSRSSAFLSFSLTFIIPFSMSYFRAPLVFAEMEASTNSSLPAAQSTTPSTTPSTNQSTSQSTAQINSEKPTKKTAIVFLIHGYLGSASSFCDLREIISERFPAQVAVVNLTYDSSGMHSSGSGLNSASFVKELHSQIANYFEKYKLPADYPYAVIAHSQGGLLFPKWYRECALEHATSCGAQHTYPHNIKLFVSLGTPYFGSPLAAKISSQDFQSFISWALGGILPLEQLKELSFGSSLISQTEDHMQPLIERMQKGDSELVNIGGDVSTGRLSLPLRLAQITPAGFWQDSESDGAVPLASSHMMTTESFLKTAARQPASVSDSVAEQTPSDELFRQLYYYPVIGTHNLGRESLACHRYEDRDLKASTQIVKLHLAKLLAQPIFGQEAMAINNPLNYTNNISTFIGYLKADLPATWDNQFPTRVALL